MNMGAGDGQELPPREEPSTTHFHRLALDKALNVAAKLRKPFHLRPRLILLQRRVNGLMELGAAAGLAVAPLV